MGGVFFRMVVLLRLTQMDNRHSFLRLQPRNFAYAKVRNLLTFFSRGLVSQLFWRLSPSEQFAQMRVADAGARARLTASLSESSLRDDPSYLRRSQQQLRR